MSNNEHESLLQRLAGSSTSIRVALTAVVAVWTTILALLILGVVLFLERPGQALQPTPGMGIPAITLEPTTGPTGTPLMIRGEGWTPGRTVLFYLIAPGQTQPPNYATAGSVVDAEGRLMVRVIVPSGPGWENQGLATVVARTAEGGASAQAFFNVVNQPEEPTATRVPSVEPGPTPTETPQVPTPTLQPGEPTAVAVTDLNIRSGPGTGYPVLGMLGAGQTAEITGVSPDRGWWQIRFSGSADERGWLSAKYVTARNTADVPIIQPPLLPATPTPAPTLTPTPTPPVIRDWRGEYFSNRSLSGAPSLVRNDVAISFDWGVGAPAAGLPADSFSARWSRDLSFSAGSYRFYARVDDGVRLWIDGALLIDQWHDSAPTTYSADVTLNEGAHSLRLEYFENSGSALAQLAWERLENYPDWKAEYYDNRKLEDDPVLVRNETKIDHNWEDGSPGSKVPAENFSARWTRKVDFDDGTYLFHVHVDDGVRLWIDDTRVIDSWQDGSPRVIKAEHKIDDGQHQVKIEYYERHGGALIQVGWQRIEEPTNKPPKADPGGPYSVKEGSLIIFDGGDSKDSDGQIKKYEWDFDYDGSNFTADATGSVAETRYPDGPANITIALRVKDDKGSKNVATTQVEVKNVAPTAEAGGPYAGAVGSPITMAGTATDPGLIDQAGLTYAWDFGDGAQAGGPIVSHSYAQPGEYTVTLIVTDKDSAQGSDTARVQVTAVNQPPTAVITGPTSGTVGETLSFDAGGSSDPDGSVVGYAWDFGDGNRGDGINVNHVYGLPGDFEVRLTVTDDGGLRDAATLSVHIAQPAPVNQPPTAVITGPITAVVSQTLQFDGSHSGDSDGSIESYAWDFGDGTVGTGITTTHIYTQTGNYQVTLTVTDDGGLTTSAVHNLQVTDSNHINSPSGEIGQGLTPAAATRRLNNPAPSRLHNQTQP